MSDEAKRPATSQANDKLAWTGLAVSIAALLVNGAVAVLNTVAMEDSHAWVTHTDQVLQQSERLLSTLQDAETGQRGFLITGDPAYLEPYHAGVAAIHEQVGQLKELTRDNATQQQRLDEIRPLIERKLAELRRTIELRQRGPEGAEAARAVVASNEGKALMDALRSRIAALSEGEVRLEEDSARRFHANSVGAIIGAVLGALVSIAVVGWAFRLMVNLRRERERAAEMFAGEGERLRTTLTSIGDAVIATDDVGRVTLINKIAEDLTGWKREEALGKPLSQVFHIINEETRQPVVSPVDRVLREGVVIGLANHTALVAKDGTERPIADSGAPIRDLQGRINGVVLVFRDQTEDRRTEQERARLAAIVESTDDAILSKDLRGTILTWNAAATRLLGYGPDETVGQPVDMIIPPDRTKEETDILSRIKAGERLVQETQRVAKGGAVLDVSITVSPLPDHDGRIVGASKIMRDITERKRTEAALREQAALLDLAHDAIIVRSAGDKITFWNYGAEETYGWTREEAIGRDAHELLKTRFPKPLVELRATVIDVGRWEGELTHTRKDGREIVVASRWAAQRDPTGRQVGVLEINRDMTERKRAEAERDLISAQRELALRAASLGWWHYDPATRIAQYDERYKAIFGVEGHASPNDEILKLLHPDDLPRVWAAVEAALDPLDPTPYATEYRVNRPDGTLRWVEAHGMAVFEGTGAARRAKSFAGTVADITDRKRGDEALRASEERFRSIAENMSEGLMIFDASGNTVFQNSASLRIHGVEASADGLFRHGALPATWRGWDAQGRSLPFEQWPISRVLRGEQFRDQVLHAECVETGRAFDGSYNGCPIRDAEGNLVYGFITIREITEQKRAAEVAEQSRKGLSRLADASLLVVQETDLQGMLQAISEAALALTDARIATCGHGEVAGRAMVGGSARAPGAPACQPGEMFVLERGGVHVDLVDRDEAIRLTDAQLRAHPRWWGGPSGHVPLRGLLGARMVGRDGKTNGMILVTDKVHGDFTEQDESLLRQLATIASLALQHVQARIAVEELDRSKSHFLAMLSHELRNPLAPIRNSLYILDRALPGGEQARRAQAVIERQTGHLTELVDELLDVTRISSGKIQLRRERVDLNELIQRAIDDYRSVFEQNGLLLEVALPEGPLWIDGDRTRLVQVVGNLLQNSAKFTELGGQISISLTLNDNLRQAVVRVRDTGIGIGRDMLPRVFEPFAQADTTLARSKGGLGLGLTLVKALIEMHGGGVTVESEGAGRGSEFVVRLPLDGGRPHTVQTPVASGARPQRILVIEDNIDAANSLREALELGNHTVMVAFSGAEGVEKARAQRPEIILCDIGLPGMDGYEVAQAIRADPALQRVKLIALTGYAAPEDVAKTKAVGFDAHVAKPLSIETLEGAIAGVT